MTTPTRPPHTRYRRLAAALLATSLGLSAAAVVPAGATPPDAVTAAATAVATGHLDWGVKQTYRSYVTGPAGQGTVTTADGATTNPDGTFAFPVSGGSLDEAAPDLAATSSGSVRFVAHDGALDLTISSLRVEADGDHAALVADVRSRSLDDGLFDEFDDIALADLDLDPAAPAPSGLDRTWTAVPATQTADGADAFGQFYAAGTSLDPLSLSLTLDDEPDPTSSTSSTTSTSTSSTSTSTSTTSTTSTPTTAPPVDGPDGERTVTGPTGQTLTVRPARGLDPDEAVVSVTGAGYDRSVGIYLAFCVDQGAAVAPSPCFGGADQSGNSLSSVWISDNPPPYAVGLTEPFGPGGSFTFDITFAAVATDDEGTTIFDCLDGQTRCVVATRADHTAPSNRSADVKVPVTFEGQDEVAPPSQSGSAWASIDVSSVRAGDQVTVTGGGFLAGEQVEVWVHSDPQWLATAVADGDGAISQSVTIPADLAAGDHHLELVGISSGLSASSATFTVVASGSAGTTATTTGTLPATGWRPQLLGLAFVLLAVGGSLVLTARRAELRRARQIERSVPAQ
jgi:hypothetical protein